MSRPANPGPFFRPSPRENEVKRPALIGVIGTIDPLFPPVPVFGVVFRDGFPSLRERQVPRGWGRDALPWLRNCGVRGVIDSQGQGGVGR